MPGKDISSTSRSPPSSAESSKSDLTIDSRVALLPSSNCLVTGSGGPDEDARSRRKNLLGGKNGTLGDHLARRYRPHGLQSAPGAFYSRLPRTGRHHAEIGRETRNRPD